MKRRNFLSTLTAAGIINAFGPAMSSKFTSAAESGSSKMDLNTILNVTDVPAIAIAGVVRGRAVRQLAGYRINPEQPVGVRTSAVRRPPGPPIEPDTYFPAASLTKPVFAWAVRDLIRQGKLELRKPMQDYLDLGLTGEAKRITPEFVLTHSSGLPNWRFQLDKPLVAEFMPGGGFQYSGGYFSTATSGGKGCRRSDRHLHERTCAETAGDDGEYLCVESRAADQSGSWS